MNIVLVEKDMLDSFDFMDPLMFLGRCAFPDRVCLAAIQKKEEDTLYEPVGMMICHISKEHYTVEWIYVREDKRKEGIGKELMGFAFKSAETKGYNKLNLFINVTPYRENICPLEGDFIEEYAFKKEQVLKGEWTADIKNCLESTIFEDSDSFLLTEPFRNLDAKVQKQIYGRMPANKDAYVMFEPDDGEKVGNDTDISQVCYKDGKIAGVLLVKDTIDKLYITALFSTDVNGEKSLLYGMLLKAKEKFGEDKKVSLLKSAGKYDHLFNAVFPGGKISASLYSTSVEEHFNMLKNLKLVDSEDVFSCVG
ncbi:MAG: GNAT family N-acetyltransferase [Lachnospiraceae bacterium]|nr:GNAT family N-acetyltransferase [Lachnospiraceae bacterium]